MNFNTMTNMIVKFRETQAINGSIKPCTLIFCADHGVAKENVSAYPKSTTAQMVRNYVECKGAAANAFAGFANSNLLVVDVGVDEDLSNLDGLLKRKIMRGTNNIVEGPAMTIEQTSKAVDIGIEIAETLIKADYNCFLPGEMGIGNTTSSAAVTAMILNVEPEIVTGRGTNISDERLAHKVEIVKKAVEINSLERSTKRINRKKKALEILSKVGGLEIAAIVGVILAARKNHSIVIIDGFNTAVAALVACEIDPKCSKCLIASHIGREKGHKIILEHLDLQPILNLNLALGEAIGSSIIYRILDNLTFQSKEDEEIEEYQNFDVDFNDEESDDFDEFDEDVEISLYNRLFNDDEEFDIELNIFNGAGIDQRYNEDFEDDGFDVDFKKLDDSNISVTDRTFNFYLNTMPILDKNAMQRAQSYIDSLSKPYGSLGLLEEIVIQIAGISSESQPSRNLKSNLICFTDNIEQAQDFKNCYEDEEGFNEDNILLDVYSTIEDFNVDLTVSLLTDVNDPAVAFDFGRMTAEDVSFKVPIIGIAIASEDYDNIHDQFEDDLLTPDGKLKFNPDEFLRHVSKPNRNLVSAVIGAIVSAAHNSSLIVTDIGAVDIIARYLEQLCPTVTPYILHSSKLFSDSYNLDVLDAEGACIAIEIVRAALYAMNEMKSFKETGVSTAIDGLGASHQ